MVENVTTKQVKSQGSTRFGQPNGNPINKATQFGQPNGNPRNNGSWKKEDTPRYKMEQMIKLTHNELLAIANDENAPLFDRRIAKSLLKENDFKTTERIINQVYGSPGTGAPEGTIQK